MNRKKGRIIAAIVAAAILVPAATYAAAPLFVNTTIDEPLPISKASDVGGKAMQDVMMADKGGDGEGAMMDKSGDAMEEKEKGDAAAMMDKSKEEGGESMMEKGGKEVMEKGEEGEATAMIKGKELAGEFAGAGDGVHNAEGTARVLYVDDRAILRLEDFKVTNGLDLYVYLSTGKDASDFVDLGRLKANIGNQNYELPEGVDLSKYGNVVIWCKSFSVYFGGAQLSAAAAAAAAA